LFRLPLLAHLDVFKNQVDNYAGHLFAAVIELAARSLAGIMLIVWTAM